jgi:hypothetical protein
MSNVQRQIFAGKQDQVTMDCGAAVAVEIGDILYLASALAVPANGLADAGNLAANQEAIHDAFIGVSRSAHRASHDPADAIALDVAVQGVFRFPVVSTAGYAVGDLIGVDEVDAGNKAHSQRVIKVAAANLSIGICTKVVSTTEVWVEICSTVYSHGLQTVA